MDNTIKRPLKINPQPGPKGPKVNGKIIAANLIVFALYSLLLVVFIESHTGWGPGVPDENFIKVVIYVILLIIHFIICMIAYSTSKQPAWLISGILVLTGWMWGMPIAAFIRYIVDLF